MLRNTKILLALFALALGLTFGLGIAAAQRGENANPQANLACVPDSYEENDTFETAVPLAMGIYTPLSRCTDDDDYYAVEVQAGETLEVELVTVQAEGDLDMTLLNEAEQAVESAGSSNDIELLRYDVPTSGTYVIRVYGFQNAENTYEMRIQTQCQTCFSYQGYLEEGGQPLNGQVEMRFRLYDQLDAGAQVGAELEQQLTAVDGLVTTQLSFPDVNYSETPLFLEVAVRPVGGSYTTLEPRQSLGSVPLASGLIAGAQVTNREHTLLFGGDDGALEISGPGSSGSVDGLRITNPGEDGIVISNPADNGIEIYNVGDDGLYISDAAETGVWVDGAGKAGIAASSTSSTFAAGIFVSQVSQPPTQAFDGGVGVYTLSADGAVPDIILGANSSTTVGDDGVIGSDDRFPESDIVLASQDKVVIKLDVDGSVSNSYFEVLDSDGNSRFRVYENGTVTPASSLMVAPESQTRTGNSVGMYMLGATENRVEDFGSTALVDGTATVSLAADFAQLIPASGAYHVYLTPLGDCPLFVAEKTAASFSVQAMGGAICSIEFDYRIVAELDGSERLPMVDSLTPDSEVEEAE